MLRYVSAVAALSVGLLGVGTARAQTPFGGDDTGFLPPAADAKCESGAAKAAGKLIACILKCHASRASGKLADDTAEDACEKTLVGKSCTALFAGAIAKLKGCPACINGTTMGNLAGTIESVIDGTNSTVYCDTSSGTPFGGDDTGDLPAAKSASAKCESGAAKAEGKLIACIDKCHASRASGKLADDTAEDACEKTLAGTSCAAKFTASIAKLSGCPACINGTTMANLAGMTESLLDANNGTIYCGGTTVTVGPGGQLIFDPATLTIKVGDTVHWVWATSGHSVVSGTNGTADNQFCSPSNTGCANPPLSLMNATYEHTFTTAGTFPYYCSVHFALGMTGTITVQ
jgi:plastocyanin